MSHQTQATPQTEERYRVADVLNALAQHGIHVARETVNRVSDAVLQLDTRSTGMLIAIGPPTRSTGLLPPFAYAKKTGSPGTELRALSEPRCPLAEQVDHEMDEIRVQLKQLAERATLLAELAELIADAQETSPLAASYPQGALCGARAQPTAEGGSDLAAM